MDKDRITITYKTADGKEICVEVSTEVKELLEQSDRQIRSQRRQDRRYHSFFEDTDNVLASALLSSYGDIADLLEIKECNSKLYDTINKLTDTQQRRLYMHFFDDLTCSQIGQIEGVSQRAVSYSICQALKKLKKLYNN
ncbi:MAG: sigma-70 family RNA polymerase sigma factor [Lachnospiraceae bacterium]